MNVTIGPKGSFGSWALRCMPIGRKHREDAGRWCIRRATCANGPTSRSKQLTKLTAVGALRPSNRSFEIQINEVHHRRAQPKRGLRRVAFASRGLHCQSRSVGRHDHSLERKANIFKEWIGEPSLRLNPLSPLRKIVWRCHPERGSRVGAVGSGAWIYHVGGFTVNVIFDRRSQQLCSGRAVEPCFEVRAIQ